MHFVRVLWDENNKLEQSKLSDDMWSRIIDQFLFDIDRIEYSSIMGVVGFTVISPQGQRVDPRTVELVKKLMERKRKYEQLKRAPEQDDRE